jgi:PhnB protein
MSAVKPIPEGYHSVTPYLTVKGALQAIDFYVEAFDAKEALRMPAPGDLIGHAELMIGNSKIMIADEFPGMGNKGPQAFGGSPITIHLYVEDVDIVYERAVKAGAKAVQPVENKFYGDRGGSILDPFGHIWHISTHVEDVPLDELMKRAAAQP